MAAHHTAVAVAVAVTVVRVASAQIGEFLLGSPLRGLERVLFQGLFFG
jgi:hypothetical protein